ncbi:MAG: tetratricopeptide repeat protein [Planctomycetes bacterium]|nr:tetratricopeptide repeat protein [Planctomycetota bacterium]
MAIPQKCRFVLRVVAAAAVLLTVAGVAPARLAAAKKEPAQASKPLKLNFAAPLNPATLAEKNRRKALAWFMTGRLKEMRNDFRGAYDAYQKAVGLDENAIEIYRVLVPLAFALGKTAAAEKYAFKAVELDPNDYRILRRLVMSLAGRKRFPQAVKLLDKAVHSKSLNKRSTIFVTLKRDLAILFSAMGDKEKAADAYLVIFDARINQKKYNLDDATFRRLETDPISSFERIGEAFLAANRSQLAIKAFQRAQKSGSGKPGNLNYNLARVYHQTKQEEKALTYLQRYFDIRSHSKGRSAYELLRTILKIQGREKKLTGRLEALAKKDPKDRHLQIFLAEQYVAAQRLKKARAAYQTAIEIKDTPSGHLGLAGVYRREKRYDDWLKEIDAVLKVARDAATFEITVTLLEPELKEAAAEKKLVDHLLQLAKKRAASKTEPLTFRVSFIVAKTAAAAKRTDPAIRYLRYALEKSAGMASSLYGELGELLMDAEKYAEAAKTFRAAVNDNRLRRSKPNFLFRLSQAEALAGNTQAAIAAVKDAQRTLPGIAFLHYQEGWIHFHARQWERAVAIFERVIAKFPQDKEIVRRCRFLLSSIFVQQGDREKGEAILEKIYAENPDDPAVNNDLGYLWAERGKNLQQAERMIRKAIKAEPENPAYLDSMGWVLYQLKKYDQALPFLKKAVEKPTGGDATIWDHLGDCYQKLKQTGKAKNAWTKALKEAKKNKRPDTKLIKKIEEKLKAR